MQPYAQLNLPERSKSSIAFPVNLNKEVSGCDSALGCRQDGHSLPFASAPRPSAPEDQRTMS